MENFFKYLNEPKQTLISKSELKHLLDDNILNFFKDSNFLELDQPLNEIVCLECNEHISEITKAKNGKFYGTCQKPDITSFFIEPDEIDIYKFNINNFLKFLSKELSIRNELKAVIKNKLWQIGKINNYFVYYSKINSLEYCKDLIENQNNISNKNFIILTNSPAENLTIKSGEILCISLLDILVFKRKLKCDVKEFKNILDNKFNKVVFDNNNGDLIVEGEIIASVTPSTKEFYFLEILFENFNYPIPHDDILDYCSQKIRKKYEERAQVFCAKLKNNIKKSSNNKQIVDKIIKSTKNKSGLNAYQMTKP